MRVFVTGGSGWIGSAVVPELLSAGHEVAGLARSDASAQALSAAGAEVARGSTRRPRRAAAGAEGADGVIHLAYIHDFARLEHSVAADEGAIRTFGDALADSGRPLVIASGILGLAPGRVGTERDTPTTGSHREPAAALTLALAERDVRASVVRLPPSVHGAGDHGFLAMLVGIARETGVSAYVGDGGPAGRPSTATTPRGSSALAVESAPAGSVLHARGRRRGARPRTRRGRRPAPRPARRVTAERALRLAGPLPRPRRRGVERAHARAARLGAGPPGLLADLEAGHYF